MLINPFSKGAEALGIDVGNNDLLKVLDYTNPIKQATESFKATSDLLKFREGSEALRKADGTAATLMEQAEKAKEKMKRDVASDQKAVDSLAEQGSLLSSQSTVLTPGRAKTAQGKQELQRLLTIFEARQSEISARRARPGAGQTRLV